MLLAFKALLILLAGTANAIIPYTPSRALLSSNASAVYIFLPSEDGSTFQLGSINLTSTLTASKTDVSIIASALPFKSQPTTAMVITIDAEDRIHLVAGDCSKGANDASLYTIIPSDPDPYWRQTSITIDGVEAPSANGGINALSGSMQFNDNMYIFGGMCPNSNFPSEDDWQKSASYSNALLSVSSDGAIAQLATRGPPVAEAGFTITPLQAAYLNHSRIVASQQNFLLIGGQTETAFLNTSQVAIFSLPEESWSFASVDTSAIGPSLESRSGHAATLSNDGQKIFVSGGWVANIDTAAQPQFLVLNIESAYGGTGIWSWSSPSQSGTAPSLYGHSMVSLPGDVIMVVGGYTFPSQSSKLRKRDIVPNTAAYFFNTSSNTWLTQYTNPNVLSTQSDQGSSSNNGLKLGLGIGLGLGLGFLLILGLCLWFGRRKIRDHRRNRDRRLLQQSMNAANGPQIHGPETVPWMTQRDDINRDPYPWAPVQGDPDSMRRASQAERTGLAYDVPSPTRGLRRSLHSRPANQSFDEGKRSRGAGHIHTIAESDESEKSLDDAEHDIIATAPILDPFQDPPHLLDRRSPSPTSPAHEREVEMQHWYNDWAEAEKHQQSGRSSPNKSDRTSSTLSDSNRSAISALSYQVSLKRDGSRKSTPQISPPETPVVATHHRKRSRSFGIGHKTAESFPKLQAEGHALLGGPAALAAATAAGEPSWRPQPKSKGLLGSVRRVLGGDRAALATTPERSATTAGRSPRDSLNSASPQRSSSLGTMTYTQRRQGAQDWGENPSPPKSLVGDAATGQDEEDWDVESAVERRVVQVMFTVPRGELRVVNAGLESDVASVQETEVQVENEMEPAADDRLLESVPEHGRGGDHGMQREMERDTDAIRKKGKHRATDDDSAHEK